ncbi:Gag-Pol poly protein [Rutstroemia sp. NJR-2017a BVV2]|nr:Gag-Pol poly protein [Rutstroemia sp. NJR-2017a BVV2]
MASNADDKYTQTKWGAVLIFNGDNWNSFKLSCIVIFSAASCLGIVENTEQEPDPIDQYATAVRLSEDYKKRRGYTISILSSAVPVKFYSELVAYTYLKDFITEVQQKFSNTIFDPKTQTLRSFVDELYRLQRLTASDIESWQTTKFLVINSRQSLEQAIVTLSTNELPITAIAYRADLLHENNNCGRGSSRDAEAEEAIAATVAEYTKDPVKAAALLEAWYYRKGYKIEEYRLFEKAKKDIRGDRKAEADTKEGGELYIAIEEEYHGSVYSSLYLHITENSTWILDSGASYHFTGNLASLQNMQEWPYPKAVKTANGSISRSYRFGNVIIGFFTLQDIWHIDDFAQTQLISVSLLTTSGYKVIFEGDSRQNGSYILAQPSAVFNALEEEEDESIKETNAELVYRCLGHLNYDDMERLKKVSLNLAFNKHIRTKGRRVYEPYLAETKQKVTIFRADNSTREFGTQFQEELKKKGIQFEPSPLGKHSLNSIAEKKIYDISSRVRKLLDQAGISTKYWEVAIKHTVWLINRVPTKALLYSEAGILSTAAIPCEAFNHRIPDFKKLRVFGCKVFPRNPQLTGKTTKKFEPKYIPGNYIFVGINSNKLNRIEISNKASYSVNSQLNTTCRYQLSRPFSNQVVQQVKALKVVTVDTGDATYNNGPLAPTEAIELEDTIREDVQV